MPLLDRRHWIFDLDGTLTLAQHDFDAIRRDLGLEPGRPILEQLAAMPPSKSDPLHDELERMEEDLAREAQMAPGAHDLLSALHATGCRLGILTRNKRRLAHIALQATGLARFFEAPVVFGRDDAEPKPSPDGIQQILDIWGATPSDAVMLGDYVFDLQAGRNAGTATVLVDLLERGEDWGAWFDVRVRGLAELLPG